MAPPCAGPYSLAGERSYGGGDRIRTCARLPEDGFQDRCIKPLCHPSKPDFTESRPPSSDLLPVLSPNYDGKNAMPLDETTATIQYRAATDIAAERFAFPSEQFPDLETHVNLPVLKMPVQGPSAELLGPDIVVTNADGGLEMVATVETVHTVNEMSARQRWLKFSRLGVPFYLYVPAGYATEARGLLKKARVKGAKLRTWRYIAGLNWTLDLTDITRDFSVADLVPPFLIDWMAERRVAGEESRQRRDEERAERQAEEAARAEDQAERRAAARAAREAEKAREPEYPHTTAPRP